IKEKKSNHSWFIDASFSPAIAIQQYDRSAVFSRSSFSASGSSDFSGKLISTEIDPSVAFSIAVRKEINKKFSISAGAEYLQLKEHIVISGFEKNTSYNIVDTLIYNVNGTELVKDT